MSSVEDARETLADVNTVFTFVEDLAKQASHTLHCFVLEFSLASKLSGVLGFPPFNAKTPNIPHPPVTDAAAYTSLSAYCSPACIDTLQYAGLNSVQEAKELLDTPELVTVFVDRLARRRPDALSTFKAIFDLRHRMNRMLRDRE